MRKPPFSKSRSRGGLGALALAAALAGCSTTALTPSAVPESEEALYATSPANIASLTDVVQRNPNDPQAYNMRGSALGQAGQSEEALADFNKAIAIDPNYAQAQQDYVTAKDAVNNYNKKYSDPVALVCKAAITPAKFVGDSITQLIGSHIKNITDYNNNNLPYYQTAIAGILTSLVDKYLFGGSNVNNQTLINEAAGIGLSAINNGNGRSASSVLIQGTDFYFKQLAVGQYQVYWDYNTAAIKSAGGSYVTIDGPGIQNKKARYGLTDSVVVDISQDELYTTHIFNASGKEILTDQVFVTNVGPVLGNPSGGSGGGNASISKPGTVAGVSVTSVFPRGQPLQLRGN